MEKDALKILCVVKHKHKGAMNTAHKVVNWFQNHNTDAVILSSHAQKNEFVAIAEDCHAGLIIGGDGTMLATARALHDKDIPLFGINYGKVGFVTEANPKDWEAWIKRFLATLHNIYYQLPCSKEDQLLVEQHNLFICTVMRDNTPVFTGYSVNDAVIGRGSVARTVSLSLFINGNHLSNLRCDGLIVSTPLGATGYAISAYGPLALPGLDAQIITPICPFAGAFPPCVVAGSSKVRIEIMQSTAPAMLTLDGQETFNLNFGDSVNITVYKNKMSLLISDPSWYLKRLVSRGYIRQGPGSQ